MLRRQALSLLGLSLTLAACGSVSTPSAPSADNGARQTYLVAFDDESLRAQSAEALSAKVRLSGASVESTYLSAQGILSVFATPTQAARLQETPGVVAVEQEVQRYLEGVAPASDAAPSVTPSIAPPDARPYPVTNPPFFRPQGEYDYGGVALRAPDLHASGFTGSGVGVCVVDSGIDATHPEFAGRVRANVDFTGEGRLTDDNSHGTHVAGTIAAALGRPGTVLPGMNASGVVGMAPSVNLYIARVFRGTGSAPLGSVMNAVKWCTEQLKTNGGAEDRLIVNMSLGGGSPSFIESLFYSRVSLRGNYLVFAAAGNTGLEEIRFPAGYPGNISVGSIDDNRNLSDFSTYSTKTELVAPGSNVLSTVPRSTGQGGGVAVGTTNFTALPTTFSGTGTVTNTVVQLGTFCTVPAGTNLAGRIAFIDRGVCSFGIKAQNAASAGAAAVIIVNNQAGDPNFTLGAPISPSIPVVGVSLANRAALVSALASTGNVGTVSVVNGDYGYKGGTSMATPHAAGSAAVVWAAKPYLSAADLRSLLQRTATDLGAPGRDNYFGFGMVNPVGAIVAP